MRYSILWAWRYCLCSVYCQCIPEVWALGSPSGMPQMRNCLYPSHGNQLGHLSCPAKGSERRCFSRVKVMEALGATLGYYLGDMACGGGTRGWRRSAGGAGWAPAGATGEPVLSLHLGFLFSGSRRCQWQGISCSQTRELGNVPGSQSITGFDSLMAEETEFNDTGDAFWSCVPACTSPVLTFFSGQRGFLLSYLDWALPSFLATRSFFQLGTSKRTSVL